MTKKNNPENWSDFDWEQEIRQREKCLSLYMNDLPYFSDLPYEKETMISYFKSQNYSFTIEHILKENVFNSFNSYAEEFSENSPNEWDDEEDSEEEDSEEEDEEEEIDNFIENFKYEFEENQDIKKDIIDPLLKEILSESPDFSKNRAAILVIIHKLIIQWNSLYAFHMKEENELKAIKVLCLYGQLYSTTCDIFDENLEYYLNFQIALGKRIHNLLQKLSHEISFISLPSEEVQTVINQQKNTLNELNENICNYIYQLKNTLKETK